MNDSPKFGSVISSRQQIVDVFIINFNKWNTNCTLNFLNPQFIKQIWQCSRNDSRRWVLNELTNQNLKQSLNHEQVLFSKNLLSCMKMTICHAYHPPWWKFCLLSPLVHMQIQCSYSLPALHSPMERQQLCRHQFALQCFQRPDQSWKIFLANSSQPPALLSCC